MSRPDAALAGSFGKGVLIVLSCAVRHLRRAPHPLLNLRVHTFRVTQAGGTLYWLACFAMPFLQPLEFLENFVWSPVKSGAVTLFIFAGNAGIKPGAGRRSR